METEDNIEFSGFRDNPIKEKTTIAKSHVKLLDIPFYQKLLKQFQYYLKK